MPTGNACRGQGRNQNNPNQGAETAEDDVVDVWCSPRQE